MREDGRRALRCGAQGVLALVLGAALLWGVGESRAQRPGQRVLDQVTVTQGERCLFVTVEFQFPVQYVSHYPQDTGTELRVSLVPVTVSRDDRDAVFQREAIFPRGAETSPLHRVVYEGDIVGGPFLTVQFSRPAAFRVAQGEDYRSLWLAVGEAEADFDCSLER